MSRLVISAFACAPLAACSGGAEAVDSEEYGVQFEVEQEALEEVSEEGVVWRLSDSEVTVTVQRVDFTDQVMRERTVASIAQALATRFELADEAASMSSRPCHSKAGEGICLDGWFEAESRRYDRWSLLIARDDHALVLSVTAAPGAADVGRHQARLLRDTLKLSTAYPSNG